MARLTSILAPLLALAGACGGAVRAPAAAAPGDEQAGSDAPRFAHPPNYNALQDLAPAGGTGSPSVRGTGANHADGRLGVPAFRWGVLAAAEAVTASARAALSPGTAIARARAHLAEAGAPGLAAVDVERAEVADLHDTGEGAVIVRFRQRLDGIEVFRGTGAVALDRAGNVVASSGSLVPSGALPADARFVLEAAEAVAAALVDLTGEAYAPGDLLAGGPLGAYATFALAPQTSAARGTIFTRAARAKRVWFRLPGRLEPAWYLEVGLARPGSLDSVDYGYVISARDGRLLFRKNQVQDAFTYRVYADGSAPSFPYDGPQGFAGSPHPTGVPDGSAPAYVPQVDVTLDHGPISANDPWLAPGATQTQGNNVDAYADLAGPDGFGTGDQRATTTASGAFLRTFDHGASPSNATNRQAAVTQLFYVNNWLHDWFYDAGFDEVSGNAQQDNLGRGGASGDRLRAEAQDFGGLDNANMLTPADGVSPRMQMYLWSPPTVQLVHVNAPAALVQSIPAGVASGWGPGSFELPGGVVPVADGASPAGDGCTALVNGASVAGKIALVDRGSCTFVVKAKNAQNAGAAGVLIRNVLEIQNVVDMGVDSAEAAIAATITVPAMLVGLAPGTAIGDAIAAGDAVNATLRRGSAELRDGELDTTVVAHEWGHYLSNRLVHDSTGLDTNMSQGLGEGWSDFDSLLLMVREEDAAVPANAGWAGVYAVGAYATGGQAPLGNPNDSYYFGIRRVPYSTDFTRNPLTFRHIADGEAIPSDVGGTAVPVQFGRDGSSNSEVHNTGEVWATMLWECYAALLDSGRISFAEAQDRMKRYLVAHFKLLPPSPTLLEARDALLAAAYAADPADYALFFEAFARRGAGIGAVGPDRYAPDNAPVVESYLAGPELSAGTPTVEGVTGDCNDGDGVIDNGETGTVAVTLTNVGTLALPATTVTLSSTDPRVSFPGGASAAVGATAIHGSTGATFQVAVSGAARGDVVPIGLTFPAGYLHSDAPRVIFLRVNYDDQANASATDTFESASLAWTAEHDPDLPGADGWRRVELEGAQHVMLGPDQHVGSDAWLVSPPIAVGTSPFGISFRQRHQFEAEPALLAYFDGGVLELSQDGGASWVDIGATARIGSDPAYAETPLLVYDGNVNPLAGRRAFTGESPGYPAFSTVTLDLGTTYSNRTVRIRFRVGTDELFGLAGWEIDDVALAGATGLPFPGLVDDQLVCGNGGAVASAGAPQRVAERSLVTLDGTGSAAENPGAVLTYAWTQIGGPGVTLAGANTPAATFTAPEVTAETVLTFELAVSDGTANATASTEVTVVDVNRAPLAEAGASRTVDENTLVTLDGSASSDPDPGSTLTYAWEQTSGREVALSATDTAVVTFTAPDVAATSAMVFRLTVSDGTLSGVSELTITVRDLDGGSAGDGGGGCGCGSGGAAGELALVGLAALLRRRRRTGRAG